MRGLGARQERAPLHPAGVTVAVTTSALLVVRLVDDTTRFDPGVPIWVPFVLPAALVASYLALIRAGLAPLGDPIWRRHLLVWAAAASTLGVFVAIATTRASWLALTHPVPIVLGVGAWYGTRSRGAARTEPGPVRRMSRRALVGACVLPIAAVPIVIGASFTTLRWTVAVAWFSELETGDRIMFSPFVGALLAALTIMVWGLVDTAVRLGASRPVPLRTLLQWALPAIGFWLYFLFDFVLVGSRFAVPVSGITGTALVAALVLLRPAPATTLVPRRAGL